MSAIASVSDNSVSIPARHRRRSRKVSRNTAQVGRIAASEFQEKYCLLIGEKSCPPRAISDAGKLTAIFYFIPLIGECVTAGLANPLYTKPMITMMQKIVSVYNLKYGDISPDSVEYNPEVLSALSLGPIGEGTLCPASNPEYGVTILEQNGFYSRTFYYVLFSALAAQITPIALNAVIELHRYYGRPLGMSDNIFQRFKQEYTLVRNRLLNHEKVNADHLIKRMESPQKLQKINHMTIAAVGIGIIFTACFMYATFNGVYLRENKGGGICDIWKCANESGYNSISQIVDSIKNSSSTISPIFNILGNDLCSDKFITYDEVAQNSMDSKRYYPIFFASTSSSTSSTSSYSPPSTITDYEDIFLSCSKWSAVASCSFSIFMLLLQLGRMFATRNALKKNNNGNV